MSNKFYANVGRFYAPHVTPVYLDCNFIVDVANGNGLGIRSLKGPGIANVFMHTSATPGVGNRNQLNPNPASGIIMVQLGDNYNFYLGGTSGFVSPSTGSPLTSTTNHVAYYIVTVGTTTAAQWQAAGLPTGITPAVGAAFIAKATGAIGGTGTVIVQGNSGISHIEVIGDPNATLSPVGITTQGGPGGQIIMQCLGATNASTTTYIPTAPADNTVVGLQFYFSNSSASGGKAG